MMSLSHRLTGRALNQVTADTYADDILSFQEHLRLKPAAHLCQSPAALTDSRKPRLTPLRFVLRLMLIVRQQVTVRVTNTLTTLTPGTFLADQRPCVQLLAA